MSVETLIARCQEKGINCIAVTDHNTIAGALEAKGLAPFKIIVGEEILTTAGEIIGYFLTEEIPKGLSPSETVARIKEQGGLVCIPHPFDPLRHTHLRREALEAILPSIDIMEVYNSYTLLPYFNTKARRFAQKHGLLYSAGSDAHTSNPLGKTYVEMPEFNDAEQFRLSLQQGRIVQQKAYPWDYFLLRAIKLAKLSLKLTGKLGR